MVDVVNAGPDRVFSLTGYPAPGAGYQRVYYLSGTTTPVTVYSDSAATVPHSSPITANSNGVFPAVFTASGTAAIKEVTTTASGASYSTRDPVPRSPLSVSTASGIGFAPTDNILATDVQSAIEEVEAKFHDDINFVDDQKATFGTGADLEIFHNGTDSFVKDGGSGSLVIQTNGTGVYIRTETPETMGYFIKDAGVELYYNGVKKFETTSAGVSVTGALDVSGGITGATVAVAAVATTSGTAFDTTIPSWANRIEIFLDAVSLSGTDNLLVQLGDTGGIETGSYVSSSLESGAVTSTSGFIVYVANAARAATGIIRIVRGATANQWFCEHTLNVGTFAVSGGGSKTLSDTLTTVRLTRTGTDTFDAGALSVRYSA